MLKSASYKYFFLVLVSIPTFAQVSKIKKTMVDLPHFDIANRAGPVLDQSYWSTELDKSDSNKKIFKNLKDRKEMLSEIKVTYDENKRIRKVIRKQGEINSTWFFNLDEKEKIVSSGSCKTYVYDGKTRQHCDVVDRPLCEQLKVAFRGSTPEQTKKKLAECMGDLISVKNILNDKNTDARLKKEVMKHSADLDITSEDQIFKDNALPFQLPRFDDEKEVTNMSALKFFARLHSSVSLCEEAALHESQVEEKKKPETAKPAPAIKK